MNNKPIFYGVYCCALLIIATQGRASVLPWPLLKYMDTNIFSSMPGTSPPSTTNITICYNQLPYSWNNITCLKAGTYTATLSTSAGTDSIAVLNLSVINVGISVTNAVVCDKQLPYTWNGHSYNASGTYSVTLTSAGGCDSVPILSLTVNHFVTSTTSKTVCSKQLPYSWNGNSYPTAGTYTVTLQSSAGCDSVCTLVLSVKPAGTSTTTKTVCSSQLPVLWNGHSYAAAGVYSVSLLAANGCDSIATLDLKVSSSLTSTTNIAVCNKQLPYSWNGHNYSGAGTYSVTLNGYQACDSIATLVLSVLPVKTSVTSVSICNKQLPYQWNGNSYASAGVYAVNLTSNNGCDSIATLRLSSNGILTTTLNRTICANLLPYSWNGNNYNSAGSYSASFLTAAGCDSVVTLNLAVTMPYVATDTLLLCGNQFPYDYHGHTFTAEGDYTIEPAVAIDACRSVNAVHLVKRTIPPGTTIAKVCSNRLPYIWNGKPYSTPGHYSITIITSGGCDSTANLELSVNPVAVKDTSITVCVNQLPYHWNGNYYSNTGTYIANLVSSSGCDSTVTLHLTVSNVTMTDTTIVICPAQIPFSWNGITCNSGGTYMATLRGSGGCDSVVTLQLSVQPFLTSTNNIHVCSNQLPYQWNGNSYPAAGTYTVTLQNTSGCDSVVTLNLVVDNSITSITNVNTCVSELPYLWNGNSYPAAGTYQATLLTSGGCDSLATLNLHVGSPVSSNTDITICNSQLPYNWNGNVFPIAGNYAVTLISSTGCDSIANLNLVVSKTLTSVTKITVCPAELPYIWNGNSYTEGGTYSVTIKTAGGCDSVPVLSLTIVPFLTSVTEIAVCKKQLPYTWNGHQYTKAGAYSVLLTGISTCDSLATLNLTVNETDTSITNVAICASQLPYSWNGHFYPSPGTYTTTLNTNNGCDSVAILNLTVNDITVSNTNIRLCNRKLPYIWNGQSLTTGGTYTASLVNSQGCDSVATLHLMVTAMDSSFEQTDICSNDLPYKWNALQLTAAGVYMIKLNNSTGCDSVATLHLNIDRSPSEPSGAAITYCQYDDAIALTSSAPAEGNHLVWYSLSVGGVGSPDAPVPSTAISGNDTFYVSQANERCESKRAIIVVTVNSKPLLGPDKNVKICFGDSLNLTALYNNLNNAASWTFDNQPVLFPDSVRLPGIYQLIATSNAGCVDTTQVNVSILPELSVNAGADGNAEPNIPYQLKGDGNGSFQWSPPELLNNPTVASPVATITKDQQFILTVSNALGCTVTDSVQLRILNGPAVYVPNAFSPNGDGKNDLFRPVTVGITSLEYFRIFNRYGELVFETSTLNQGWDGTYKGIRQGVGNYVWMLKGTDRFGKVKMQQGNVVLIR